MGRSENGIEGIMVGANALVRGECMGVSRE